MLSENLLALADVPQHLPDRRGKRVHYSTVYRWATRGAGGRVLETVRIGGVLFTSQEALGRFTSPAVRSAPGTAVVLSPNRVRDLAAANAVLDAEGVK